VSPVTGPFNAVVDIPGFYKESSWFRQAKPYDLQLNYHAFRCAADVIEDGVKTVGNPVTTDAWANCAGPGFGSVPPEMERLMQQSYAKAYDQFMYRAKNSASLAVSLAEGKQSIQMIAQRVGQLLAAARALRKGDIASFTKQLGVKNRSSARDRKRHVNDAAGTWLEFTFGWAPLVKDIGSAVEVLQQDFDPHPIRGRGTSQSEIEQHLFGYITKKNLLLSKTEIRGQIKVTNTDLFLANSLGFVNPATVAWELVPFSFVVDWFIPVGKFLSLMTDRVGLEIVNPSVSYKRQATCIHSEVNGELPFSRVIPSTGSSLNRVVGDFGTPSLLSRSRLPTADAWLAATSVSLLVQQFRKFR